MANEVDAVIAALHTLLKDAEARKTQHHWDPMTVNRWIHLLPAQFAERSRHMILLGHNNGWTTRDDLIGHVKATISYLQATRKVSGANQITHDVEIELSNSGDTIDADYTDLTEGGSKKAKSGRRQLRLFKGKQP